MPRGSDPQREREYETLVDKFEHEHRYPGREEEVAARIVNKQRAQHGETIAEQEAERQGDGADRELPIPHYDTLDVDEITPKLAQLSREQVEAIRDYELAHNHRKTLLEQIARHLS